MLSTIRKSIRRIRLHNDYTQEDLSRECDYDKTYIGKIERGDAQPSIEAILRIAKVLSVPPVDFFREGTEDRISEVKQLKEIESVERENRYENIFMNLPGIAILTNFAGQIIEMNKAAKNFFKSDSGDLNGTAIKDIPIWGQMSVDRSLFDDLIDLGSIGKRASRRLELTYKGTVQELQFHVSSIEEFTNNEGLIIIEILVVESTKDRTLLGGHSNFSRQMK